MQLKRHHLLISFMLGAIIGGITVAVSTKALPKIMSGRYNADDVGKDERVRL